MRHHTCLYESCDFWNLDVASREDWRQMHCVEQCNQERTVPVAQMIAKAATKTRLPHIF